MNVIDKPLTTNFKIAQHGARPEMDVAAGMYPGVRVTDMGIEAMS